MTSLIDPPFALLRRLERGEKLLGVLFDGDRCPATVTAGLDFAVVGAAVPAAAASALAAGSLPVLQAADIILSEDGPARLATSVQSARAAFASGADIVVYDAGAMIDELMGSLVAGRPGGENVQRREPLVLLSGMLGDARLWDDVAASLADVALPWPARIDRDDSIAEMAGSVLAEAPPRFALAGHSLGAVVALEIIRQAPERVSRLALLNASARGPAEVQIESWQRWHRRTEEGEFDEVATELARATLSDADQSPELVTRNRRMADTVGREGFLRQLAAQCTRPDSRAALATIDVPVLVLSGQRDEICPPALQAELAQLCPPARLATIAEAGHMAPLEQPAAVTAVLREWLAVAAIGSAQ